MKLITRIVLFAFVYSFVVHEPLYAAVTMETSARARAALERRLSKLVLSAQYGRIADGGYQGKRRLIVFIQDLHCNAEVQRNISEILGVLDRGYGLERIYVEGAPEGKADLSLFTGISDRGLKEKTLDSLLSRGLLSGAVYYAAKNDKSEIYGLEKWGLYRQNVERMQRLLGDKEQDGVLARQVGVRLEETKALHGSYGLRKADYYLHGGDGKPVGERYGRLAKLAAKNKISLLEYPNVRRQVKVAELSGQIRYKRLAAYHAFGKRADYGIRYVAVLFERNVRDTALFSKEGKQHFLVYNVHP